MGQGRAETQREWRRTRFFPWRGLPAHPPRTRYEQSRLCVEDQWEQRESEREYKGEVTMTMGGERWAPALGVPHITRFAIQQAPLQAPTCG